jgi:hypothetical protein
MTKSRQGRGKLWNLTHPPPHKQDFESSISEKRDKEKKINFFKGDADLFYVFTETPTLVKCRFCKILGGNQNDKTRHDKT